jgi:small ligand-binding sensory domain FIST
VFFEWKYHTRGFLGLRNPRDRMVFLLAYTQSINLLVLLLDIFLPKPTVVGVLISLLIADGDSMWRIAFH